MSPATIVAATRGSRRSRGPMRREIALVPHGAASAAAARRMAVYWKSIVRWGGKDERRLRNSSLAPRTRICGAGGGAELAIARNIDGANSRVEMREEDVEAEGKPRDSGCGHVDARTTPPQEENANAEANHGERDVLLTEKGESHGDGEAPGAACLRPEEGSAEERSRGDD